MFVTFWLHLLPFAHNMSEQLHQRGQLHAVRPLDEDGAPLGALGLECGLHLLGIGKGALGVPCGGKGGAVMKGLLIVITAVLCLCIRSEILSMMGLIAGGIGFLGMIAKEAIEK